MPILYFLLFFAVSSFTVSSAEGAIHVLVTVAPHKFFVEQIGGDEVSVDLMVPAGASAHTFEPTPKQILRASQADIWFTLGEEFETRATKALQAYKPQLQLVDLKKKIDVINTDPHSGACCSHCRGQDLHIWLSVRQAKIQAETIAETLIAIDVANKEKYQKRLEAFIHQLDSLDHQLQSLLASVKGKTVMVSHPAYAYFCRDYELKQLSIEFEGKDPTPRQLTHLLTQAKALHIDRIFIQAQYNNKGARLFAEQLNAKLIMLDPYAEDYINAMISIAQAFGGSTVADTKKSF